MLGCLEINSDDASFHELISKKRGFMDQTNIYLRLKRLLSANLMGELFKVILAYKSKSNKFFGFN